MISHVLARNVTYETLEYLDFRNQAKKKVLEGILTATLDLREKL